MSQNDKKCCKSCVYYKPSSDRGLCTLYINKLGLVPVVYDEELCAGWATVKAKDKVLLDIYEDIPYLIERPIESGLKTDIPTIIKKSIDNSVKKDIKPKKTKKTSIQDILKSEGLDEDN